jgi:polysaccharide export outer membrane protein
MTKNQLTGLFLSLGLAILGSSCSTPSKTNKNVYQPSNPGNAIAETAYNERTDEERELARFSPSSVLDRVRIRETRKELSSKDLDYFVGPDDELEISIFEWELTESTRSLKLRVSKQGRISLPGLPPINVQGKSVENIQEQIISEMSKEGILQNPRITVSVIEYRSKQISAIGAINAPGVYAIRENVATLTDFLSLAGGPSADAAPIAYILRSARTPDEEPLKITVDLDELFKTRRTELDATLQGGDVVYVPEAPLVYVYGSVLTPGGISLKKPTTFLEAIALAGGFDNQADTSRVRLNRKTRGVREESLYVNVDRIENGQDRDPYLHEGDVIIVSDAPSKQLAKGMWEVFRNIFSISYRLNADSSN